MTDEELAGFLSSSSSSPPQAASNEDSSKRNDIFLSILKLLGATEHMAIVIGYSVV